MSKTHAQKTHNIQYIEYRIQNTKSKTHVLKITNVPVFSIALGLNDFDAGKFITR